MVRRLFLVMATLGLCVCAVDSQVRRQTQPRTGIELRGGDRERQNNFRKAVGVRYPSRSELGAIAATGYNFASIELGSRSPEEWEPAVKRAESLNLQLLVGIWPLPWRYNNNGTWTANPEGIQFLRLMRQYPKTVIGMYGFNEPYWTNPATGRNDFECGFYTADDLRAFRRMIRSYWPEARIYHDLGEPSYWAPGGKLHRRRSCIGNKYRDQTEIADFVGVWWFPFEIDGYKKESALADLREEIQFIREKMSPAEPVLVGQAFASKSSYLRFPTKAEMSDWNCALRQLPAQYLIWYPWRHDSYEENLVDHPDYWPLTVDDACR